MPEALKLVLRKNEEHPTGPIFRNAHGEPWNPDTLALYLYQLRLKYKASKELAWLEGQCLDGLRHTFATKFIVANPDKLEYLRELLATRT